MEQIKRSEKELLSKYRNVFLNEENKSIEDWKNYAYIPLDIPKFDCPEIVEWFFNRCAETKKLNISHHNPSIYDLFFNTVEIYYNEKSKNRTKKYRTANNLTDEFMEKFPDFYNKLLENFPFKSVGYLMFLNCTDEVKMHRDHENIVDGPTQFRIMLYDENPISTLGFVDSLPDTEVDLSKKFLTAQLEDTNSLAWNNLRVKHGSSYNPKYKKIILGIIDYELDMPRLHDLMKRSVEKYQQHAMIIDRPTSDYVNV